MVGPVERTDVVRITIELQGLADTDEVAVRVTGPSGADLISLGTPTGGAEAADAGRAPLDVADGPGGSEGAPGPGGDANAGAARVADIPPVERAG
jgi:hypothetical protein